MKHMRVIATAILICLMVNMCFVVSAADDSKALMVSLAEATETNRLTVNKDTGRVNQTNAGGFLKIEKVNFGTGGFNSVSLNVACTAANAGGTFAIYLDSKDTNPIGKIVVQSTGSFDDFVWQTTGLSEDIEGEHDLYITSSKAGCGDLMGLRFNYLKGESDISQIPNGMKGTEYEKIAERLAALGLISFEGKSSVSVTEAVKAKEAAEVLFGLVNITELTVIDKFLNDEKIDPKKTIKQGDLSKILVNIFAYDKVAKTAKNYETECIRYVKMKGLFGNKLYATKNTISRGELYWLLDTLKDYAAVVENAYTLHKNGSLIGTQFETYDESYLSYYKNIYKGIGIITAGEYAAMEGFGVCSEGEVRIGSVIFDAKGTDAAKHIGEKVEFYYKTEPGRTKLITYDNGENEIITVDESEIGSLSSKGMTYYDEKDRERKINFETLKTVIYNGKKSSSYDERIFNKNTLYGNVTAVDNDDDGNAEVVKIEDTYDLVVNSYADDKIYSKPINPYTAPVIVDLKDRDVVVKNLNGETVDKDENLGMLAEWNVVSVACSKNDDKGIEDADPLYTIYLNNKVARGSIKSITSSGGNVIYKMDNGTERIIKKGVNVGNVRAGDYIIACLNYRGQIVAIRYVSGMKPGYILGYHFEDGLEQELQVKILGEDSIVHIYTVGKSINIDSKTWKKNAATATEFDDINESFVLYQAKENGIITAIDTARPLTANENKDTLRVALAEVTDAKYKSSLTFDGKAVFEADTPVFCIAEDGGDEFHYVSTQNLVFVNDDKNLKVSTYNMSEDSLKSDWIVYKFNSANIKARSTSNVVYVDEIITEYDTEKQEVYKVLNVYDSNKLYSYRLTEAAAAKADSEVLSRGDAIKVSVDINGCINSISRKLKVNPIGTEPRLTLTADADDITNNEKWNTENQYLWAQAERFDGTYAKLSSLENPGTDLGMYNISAAGLYLYDKEEDEIRLATLNEIADIKHDAANPTKMFVHINYAVVKSILIVK